MKKFKFQKLIRDKIPGDIGREGGKVVSRILNDDEYLIELKKKLAEESEELFEAGPEKLVGEISDIQEIIDNMLEVLKIPKSELAKKQKEKNEKYGSFRKRIFVKEIELPENHKWLDYYLSNPDRYSEIKDFSD